MKESLKKAVLAAAATWGSVAFFSPAHAYSLELVYDLAVDSCINGAAGHLCDTYRQTGSPGQLTIQIRDYELPANPYYSNLPFDASMPVFGLRYSSALTYIRWGMLTSTSDDATANGAHHETFGGLSSYEPAAYLPVNLAASLSSGTFLYFSVPDPAQPGEAVNGSLMLHSFRDTSAMAPVPEPQAYALLLAGLGVLGIVRPRRRVNAG